MSELSALITKKDELLAQIRRIEESCEGIENEANARRIAELNEQQMRFSAEKRDLQSKLSALENHLTGISSKIQELSGTGIDRILEAIKNQRWFYFKNRPQVFMDKTTGIMWNNPHYLPFEKPDGSSYSINEAKNIVKDLSLGDYLNWHIVTRVEFEHVACRGGFPFYTGDYKQIANMSGVIIDWKGNGDIRGIWTDRDYGRDYSGPYVFLVCNSSLTSEEYEANVKNNQSFSEKERLQFTLNLFVTNGLEPIFDNSSITDLYRQIYVEKPALLQQLSTLQSQINALQEVVLLSSTFDYHALLTGYDIPAINNSVIQYHEAVTALAKTFLDKVREYEAEKKATIRAFDAAGMKLGIPYRAHPKLSEAENEVLDDGRSFLARHLSLNMEGVKQQICSVQEQGETLAKRIAAVNRCKDSLGALAQIASEERPDFALVAENLAHIVRDALKKIEFFEAHHDFALRLIKMWTAWEADCIDFKTVQRDGFLSNCEEHGLPVDWAECRYADWTAKRLVVEQSFQVLADFVLQGHLLQQNGDEPTAAEKAFLLLQAYREDMDGFYCEELWKLNAEFGSAEDYGCKEKLETEKAFYWRTAHWMKGEWRNWLFSLPDADDRQFLVRLIDPMIAAPAEALLDYTRTYGELPTPSELIFSLMFLQDPMERSALDSAEAYENELNHRGEDFATVIAQAGEIWKDAPAPGTETPDNAAKNAETAGIITISKAEK